jgi:hypothetical protein
MTHIRIAFAFRAERRAAPQPARRTMCLPVNPASIVVPAGDRPTFTAGEGQA